MLLFGVLTFVALIFFAPLLTKVVFGESYSAAVEIIRILALCIPLRFLSTSIGASLLTNDNMRNKVKLMGIIAIINIFLNLTLIPKFGLHGAAISTIASETLLLILYSIASAKLFKNLGHKSASDY
ncbi:hypothetical protein D9M73_249380 [compost metagenome]